MSGFQNRIKIQKYLSKPIDPTKPKEMENIVRLNNRMSEFLYHLEQTKNITLFNYLYDLCKQCQAEDKTQKFKIECFPEFIIWSNYYNLTKEDMLWFEKLENELENSFMTVE